MISNKSIQSEKGLRDLIVRNLRKEIHPGTKPSVDFIHKILEEAYASGMAYDVQDMHSDILTFALMSSNQSAQCIKIVQTMKFASENTMANIDDKEAPFVFFDVEVYPNLLIVCWNPRCQRRLFE